MFEFTRCLEQPDILPDRDSEVKQEASSPPGAAFGCLFRAKDARAP